MIKQIYLVLFLFTCLQSFSQENDIFYFSKNGMLLPSSKNATKKKEIKSLSKNKFEIVEYSKLFGEWQNKGSKEIVTKKKDRFIVNHIEFGEVLYKLKLIVTDTLPKGFIVKSYKNGRCIKEAEAKYVFPLVLHGKAKLFPDPNNCQSKNVYYYNNLKYKKISPFSHKRYPTIDLPDNHASLLPQYPGGISVFYQDLGTKLKFPNDNKTEIKGSFLVSFSIGIAGNVFDPKVIEGTNPEFNDEVIMALKRLDKKWLPAQNEKKENINYKYIIPFDLSVDAKEPASHKNKKTKGQVRVVYDRADKKPEYPGGGNGLRDDIATLIKRIPRGSASGYRGKFENLKVFMTF